MDGRREEEGGGMQESGERSFDGPGEREEGSEKKQQEEGMKTCFAGENWQEEGKIEREGDR